MWEERIEKFTDFREELHASFPYRADALSELIDSIGANTTARSAVELSLTLPFHRCYSRVHEAVASVLRPSVSVVGAGVAAHQRRLIAETLVAPSQRPFRLLAVDVTPAPRRFAPTLADRGVVHYPNPAPGNKPIVMGHQYSVVAALPEKAPGDAPWVVPLSCQRVTSAETGTAVGAQQMAALLQDEALPFGDELTVEVADTAYSAVSYLHPMSTDANHLLVVRVSANRTFYHQPVTIPDGPGPAGHPLWYGTPFRLADAATWGPPDDEAVTTLVTGRGRELTVTLHGWHDLLMRGKKGLPMHQCPFTLVRCSVTDADGKRVFKRPLWLLIVGRRRAEMDLIEAYHSYRQRYDVEHFFRFGKTHLLMDKYQTCVTEHEETWWELSGLAYVQLWLAAPLASGVPRPWEHDPRPDPLSARPGPARVQRDFGRIIRQFGSPAVAPKPRGNSPGRRTGACPGHRSHQPVVFKGKKRTLPKAA